MIGIKNPEHYEIKIDNETHYGFNQEWYPTPWQRLSGCGPTTASSLLHYWLLPNTSSPSQTEALEWMETLWTYVTPGIGGVYKVETFKKGIERYLNEQAIPSKIECFRVAKQKANRRDFGELIDFLSQAFTHNSPVAFLNLHNGHENTWDDWHWTLAIGMYVDPHTQDLMLNLLDDGKILSGNLKKWYDTTKHGGGFVTILNPATNTI
jgi:hypothetical protein